MPEVDPFINIAFQNGLPSEVGINGTTLEEVIDVLIGRLGGWQAGEFCCRENALAITALEDAQNWLYRRTRNRIKAGVEGTYQKH
jgi:hypothetical protein